MKHAILLLLVVALGCTQNGSNLPGPNNSTIKEIPIFAKPKGNDAHGGDGFVGEFKNTADRICRWLSHNPSPLSGEAFCKTISETKIESTIDPIYVEKIEKDAANWPSEMRILFNRDRWQSLRDEHRRWQLVIHEVVPLMAEHDELLKKKGSDKDYKISSQIILAAFPEILTLGSYYQGRLPVCESQAIVRESTGETQPVGSLGFYLSTGEIDPEKTVDGSLFVKTAEGEHHIRLAHSLRCNYWSFPLETLSCSNRQGHKFTMARTESGTTVSVKSSVVSDRLLNDRAAPIGQSLSEPAVMAEKQWGEMLSGFLPFRLEELKMVDYENYKMWGASALVDEITMSFPSAHCRWVDA